MDNTTNFQKLVNHFSLTFELSDYSDTGRYIVLSSIPNTPQEIYKIKRTVEDIAGHFFSHQMERLDPDRPFTRLKIYNIA